ncbi:MAG: hypothetical protein KDD70_07060 [Bdellovibrionales bacterium]|nr:hypothetical protein [Bdellovibrionales bacterium]
MTKEKNGAARQGSGAQNKKAAPRRKTSNKGFTDEQGEITSSKELKEFLLAVRDRMADDQAAAVNVASAMNYVLNISNIEELLDKESKEVARDVWLRIKQVGVQLRNPPILFDADEEVFPQTP